MEEETLNKIKYAGIALILCGVAGLKSLKVEQGDNSLEQKAQKEVIIDSTATNVTNYQNSFNYLDCDNH